MFLFAFSVFGFILFHENRNHALIFRVCFISYLTAPKPTLGRWWVNHFTSPVFITMHFLKWPRFYWVSRGKVDAQSTTLVFETGTIQLRDLRIFPMRFSRQSILCVHEFFYNTFRVYKISYKIIKVILLSQSHDLRKSLIS